MTANIRMPLVNSEKNAQIGKVLKEVDTTSEIYQLFESNFNASDRKSAQFWIFLSIPTPTFCTDAMNRISLY
ncbi:hypothetical protein [Nostoc sp.]|uniref:hypothetical protein n=1 Tax=Nostoc sp. TaxID=1180 RepID=UPI002FF4CFB4